MITLAGANATGATILVLDDPSVDTDQGVSFAASFKSAAFDISGDTSGYATLRRLVQATSINGPVTVTVTPIGDGSEFPSQAVTVNLDTKNGADQEVEVPVWVPATRFQFRVSVPTHVGLTEFGESDQWFVIRRDRRTG